MGKDHYYMWIKRKLKICTRPLLPLKNLKICTRPHWLKKLLKGPFCLRRTPQGMYKVITALKNPSNCKTRHHCLKISPGGMDKKPTALKKTPHGMHNHSKSLTNSMCRIKPFLHSSYGYWRSLKIIFNQGIIIIHVHTPRISITHSQE